MPTRARGPEKRGESMIAHESEITTTNLTTEERKLLKDRLMDENYVRIEDDLARAPRKDDPKKLVGPNVARLVRYLLLHDGMRSNLDDTTETHKTDAAILDDLGIKRDALKSARELGEAEGIMKCRRDNRPGDGRRTTVYGVKVVGLTRKINNSEIARAEDKLRALEGNRSQWARRQREYLEVRVATLRETLDLLEHICGEPENVQPVMRITDLSWSHHYAVAPLEPEDQRRWLEAAAPEPELTDEDAPDEDTPVDWLPESLHTGTYGEEVNEETRSLECVNPQFNVWETHALQQSLYNRKRHEVVTREPFFNKKASLDGASLSAPPDVGDEFSNEPEITSSTPSTLDSLDGNGTEEEVSTDPPETTAPMPAREAWALYERGEVTLMEVERLCRPRGKEREVAA